MNRNARINGMVCLLMLMLPGMAAASIVPSLRSEWLYFNLYEPETDCFLDDESALMDRMATHEASANYCDTELQGWTTSWPNSEGRTSYNRQCPPVSGTPYAYGWIHEESRTFRYGYKTLAQCGNANFNWTNDYIRRHFFYYCPSGYTLFQPVKDGNGTPYSPNIPACRSSGTAPEKEKNLGPQQCPVPLEGNPINVATGNKLQHEVDYESSGAFPLRFERFYNSQGEGWTFAYTQHIEIAPINTQILMARLHRPDGRVISLDNQTGSWRVDADISYKLTSTTDTNGVITSFELTLDNDDVESYDGNGKLLAVRNRAGMQHTIAYDASGSIQTVTHTSGATLAFTTDASGRIDTMTDPAGQLHEYDYDGSGNLTDVSYPGGVAKHYLYNEAAHTGGTNLPRALTGIQDESGQRFATYKYDSSGRATWSEHAGSERVSVTYNSNGTATVDEGGGGQRTYSFTTKLGVLKTASVSGTPCPSCGSAASYAYNANGVLEYVTDRRGVRTRYILNSRNLRTSTYDNDSQSFGGSRRITTHTWHPTYRLPTGGAVGNKSTTHTYDTSGNLLTTTTTDTSTAESRSWTFTYDAVGQVLTSDGPRTDVNDITTYYNCTTGYRCGQVETITNAAGHVTTYNIYNAHGQPLTMTDPNGVVTTLTYDARRRLTTRSVGTELWTFDYWPTGLLKKATLPDGSYLEYAYNAAHQLTDINDAEGNSIHYTLDMMGNRTNEDLRDPSATLTQTRTRVFNALNQLWKQIGAAGTAAVTTEYLYDGNGNLTNTNAPLGRNSVNSYDAFNRFVQLADPASGLTKYGYNTLDQLVTVTDPRNKVTTYTINALGDIKRVVSPDTGTSNSTFDGAGNLATRTDARNKTGTYTYDALNRVTQLSYPDQTIGYTYDQGANAIGRLSSVSDESGSTAWSYETHGRITSRQQTMGSIAKSIGYGYNSVGQLETLTLPSGNVVTYSYANGKVDGITLNGGTPILSNVLYQPFGPTSGWTWGNGTFAVREYDTDGKITDIDSAGLKTYGYDDALRITSIVDADDSSRSQSYGYDLLDRLTSATGSSLDQGWTYDANGNRLTQTGSSTSTYTVSSSSNRLSAVSGALSHSYDYDAAGNITSDGTRTFTYDDAGRMVSATKAGVTATYHHNALGQRVRKSSGGSSTYFVYDEAGHLLGEYDNTGALIQETVWFGDTPVATLIADGSGGADLFYVHADHLDTPRRISRPSDNAVLWRWDSDPFGTTSANEDADGDSTLLAYNLRLPGQYFDSETGLHYNYFRDGYDPAVGRYTQSDPLLRPNRFFTDEWAFYVPVMLRSPQWLHPYSYVTSQPLLESDPLGLGPWGILKCLWMGKQMIEYNEQCKGECTDDFMKQLRFMQKYDAVFLDEALLNCTCTKAAQDGKETLCAKWAATCVTSALPTPRRP